MLRRAVFSCCCRDAEFLQVEAPLRPSKVQQYDAAVRVVSGQIGVCAPAVHYRFPGIYTALSHASMLWVLYFPYINVCVRLNSSTKVKLEVQYLTNQGSSQGRMLVLLCCCVAAAVSGGAVA